MSKYIVFFSSSIWIVRTQTSVLDIIISETVKKGSGLKLFLNILDEDFVELQSLFKTHEFRKRTSVGASAIVARKSI